MSAPAIPANGSFTSSAAFYAVAKDETGKVRVIDGPHPASDAHRLADAPEFRRDAARVIGHGFAGFGVIRTPRVLDASPGRHYRTAR